MKKNIEKKKLKIGSEKKLELELKLGLGLEVSGEKSDNIVEKSDKNSIIINSLQLLSQKERGNIFKHKAYENAIKVIEGMPPIQSVGDVDGVAGIGKGIREKIGLILDGKFVEPEREKEIYEVLINIYGVGEKKAKELIEKEGICDLLTLKQRQDELLNEKQKIGLKYYEPLLLRIPYNEMTLHDRFIRGIWGNDYYCQGYNFDFEVVGSYRRKELTSGDIDILITFEESLNLLGRLVYSLRRNKYVIETLAEGGKKFMGICKLPGGVPRRIDIIWCSREEYPFALFYFTGSEKYNRRVREIAAKKGYRLNEKELVAVSPKTGKLELPIFEMEKDITDFLGLPYLEPNLRKN